MFKIFKRKINYFVSYQWRSGKIQGHGHTIIKDCGNKINTENFHTFVERVKANVLIQMDLDNKTDMQVVIVNWKRIK